MSDFPIKLAEKLTKRERENALRLLPQRNNLIDFSSNDYLGFAKNQTIYAHTFQLLLNQGDFQNGATGSRLLTGNHSLYKVLEDILARTYQTESALVFNSGYDANLGFFTVVPQRGDLVFFDEYIHASIRDGIDAGMAKGYKFAHNDLEDLTQVISRVLQQQSAPPETEIYIVTESVFSMDGDTPNVRALAQFCTSNNYRLVVDEAHAIGVFGPKGTGLLQDLELHTQVFARIITFGKAMGCHGAAIVGSTMLKTYLVNFARSLIYTTALTPHTIASVISAYEYAIEQGEDDRAQLYKNISIFKARMLKLGLQDSFIPSDSAIHCCIISGNEKAKKVASQLQENGFNIKPILAPTVPLGQERLRFCLHSYNSKEEIELALELLGTLNKKFLETDYPRGKP
ncbi:aminotransferase class I/II-fold pyridoxal phosphate-dependent enzyme [Arenibacter sp. GZD96]|uniref:aminotransferase class I/II-fold pyridoxal phosphate-dependent enzyme n=1 Tax=Aurantibrevibacter litoralis TaxID=3106030 RepID=UPI002AFF6141|nr:aminotransferase class I/II-fold pyridoxal phosphate-dependent enzyme [Arenibacter sp. GZD-96]MEA1787236.1 aminotransferase class I/II-fold pyridoxal phosphate-dependent enzyme [Arenibacter sp. GZD-96]